MQVSEERIAQKCKVQKCKTGAKTERKIFCGLLQNFALPEEKYTVHKPVHHDGGIVSLQNNREQTALSLKIHADNCAQWTKNVIFSKKNLMNCKLARGLHK